MKIGTISDLHIDRHTYINSEGYMQALVDCAIKRQLDLLIIAGDISNNYQMTCAFISQVKAQINIPVLFVPGNHDYWSDQLDHSSTDIVTSFRQQPECLMTQPYIINDNWAIIGSTAWYDYSYAHERFSEEQLQIGKHYGATWQDKVRIDWTVDDRQLSKQFADELRAHASQVAPRKLIIVTHIVTHPAFMVPTPHRLFDFFNAYIGTTDIDSIYQDYPVRYSIMGHVHFRKELTENGITYLCPCLGYQRQWRTDDIISEVNHALMDFTINN